MGAFFAWERVISYTISTGMQKIGQTSGDIVPFRKVSMVAGITDHGMPRCQLKYNVESTEKPIQLD